MPETAPTTLSIDADALHAILQPLGTIPIIVTARGDRDGQPRVLLEYDSAEDIDPPDPSVLPALTSVFGPLLALRDNWRISHFTLYYDPQFQNIGGITIDVAEILALIHSMAAIPTLLVYVPSRRSSAKPSARLGLTTELDTIQAVCNLLDATGANAVINEDSLEFYTAIIDLVKPFFHQTEQTILLSELSLSLDIAPDSEEDAAAALEWLGSERCPADLRTLVQNKYIGPFSDAALLAALERATPGSNDDVLLDAARQRFAALIGGPSSAGRAAVSGAAPKSPGASSATGLWGRLWSKIPAH